MDAPSKAKKAGGTFLGLMAIGVLAIAGNAFLPASSTFSYADCDLESTGDSSAVKRMSTGNPPQPIYYTCAEYRERDEWKNRYETWKREHATTTTAAP